MSERTLSNTRAVSLVILVIRLYQRAVSPLLPPSCRFTPTCSEYAAEALQKHGLGRGLLLALGRLLRCHPFHPGGLDPVPGITYDKERRDGPKDSVCPPSSDDRPHRLSIGVCAEAEAGADRSSRAHKFDGGYAFGIAGDRLAG